MNHELQITNYGKSIAIFQSSKFKAFFSSIIQLFNFQSYFCACSLVGLTGLMSGCISSFEPVGVKDTAGILVVEGMILERGTTVKLSRSVKLEDRLNQFTFFDVSGASVMLIDEAQQVIASAWEQTNVDRTTTGINYVFVNELSFEPDKKYALDIKVGGKHYRSDFVSMVHTPEIDEVSWQLNEDTSIDIMVSTHDPANKVSYYLWSFEEDWEIISPAFGSFIFDPAIGVIQQNMGTAENRYYCWDSDKSKSLLLASSDKLSEAVISNKKIYNFPSGTTRFSYLYSILVKQYGLEKEAYAYLENLQRNVEEGGSLFAPQPSEKAGNIQCLTDPNEPVIGYIALTKETTYRLYIDMNGLRLSDRFSCTDDEELYSYGLLPQAYSKGLGIREALNGPMGSVSYICVEIRCVDCTKRGGTKNKPDFWPNNHL